MAPAEFSIFSDYSLHENSVLNETSNISLDVSINNTNKIDQDIPCTNSSLMTFRNNPSASYLEKGEIQNRQSTGIDKKSKESHANFEDICQHPKTCMKLANQHVQEKSNNCCANKKKAKKRKKRSVFG